MRDRVDFERSVARFGHTDIGYIVEVLQNVYRVMDSCDSMNTPGSDGQIKLLFGDLIEALDECDSIEIVRDEEVLVDEG